MTNTRRICIGYGPHDGKCENVAGTPWTPYWCPRCDELRKAAITKSLEDILRSFDDARVADGAGRRERR